MKKYSLFIIIIPLVLVIAGLIFWLPKKEINPMKIMDCEYAPSFQYWKYWEKDFDFEKNSWEAQKNKRQGNYYASCMSEGTAKMLNAYVFKDYKLLFKQEDIYRGQFFKGNDGSFYVIQGIMNPDVNVSPLGYILTKLEFDPLKDVLVETETKEYKTKQEIESLYEFEKENNNYNNDLLDIKYDQVVNSKLDQITLTGKCEKTKYDGKEIEWQGKISAHYSQITGIKFCVVDEDHQAVDIHKPCDWFWASSDDVMGADDPKINPGWDGYWVKYILNYYKVSFDESKPYYNDIYTIKGVINGLDDGVESNCVPNIDIISITK